MCEQYAHNELQFFPPTDLTIALRTVAAEDFPYVSSQNVFKILFVKVLLLHSKTEPPNCNPLGSAKSTGQRPT